MVSSLGSSVALGFIRLIQVRAESSVNVEYWRWPSLARCFMDQIISRLVVNVLVTANRVCVLVYVFDGDS